MKIKTAQFYQTVKVGKDLIKAFTPDEFLSDGALHKGHKAEMHDKGILITTKTETALIPWANVQLVVVEKPELEVKPAKAEKSKSESK